MRRRHQPHLWGGGRRLGFSKLGGNGGDGRYPLPIPPRGPEEESPKAGASPPGSRGRDEVPPNALPGSLVGRLYEEMRYICLRFRPRPRSACTFPGTLSGAAGAFSLPLLLLLHPSWNQRNWGCTKSGPTPGAALAAPSPLLGVPGSPRVENWAGHSSIPRTPQNTNPSLECTSPHQSSPVDPFRVPGSAGSRSRN